MTNNGNDLQYKRELLAKLSNRANTRLRAQEKNGLKNDAYYEALENISALGGIGTRFSRSKKLDEKTVEKQLDFVEKYLSDETSTKRGYLASKKINTFDIFDMGKLSKMSRKEIEKEYQKQSKSANSKMRALERAGFGEDVRAMGQAKTFLRDDDLSYYPTSKKEISKMTDEELARYLQNVSKFNNYKTNTVRGIQDQNMKGRLALKKAGYEIPIEHEQDFFNFLGTQTGKVLKKLGDSTQYMERFSQALQGIFTVDDIRKATEQFITDNSMTFDEYLELFDTHNRYE